MIPEEVANDPGYRALFEKTRMVARNRINDIARPSDRKPFAEATFTAAVVGLRQNAVGGLILTLETAAGEKDNAWPLSDANAAGEEIEIHAMRKA